MGGTKGAMLALVVELLVTALTGAAMGFEASSFFVDEGNRPRIGQAFLVIDPDALAGRTPTECESNGNVHRMATFGSAGRARSAQVTGQGASRSASACGRFLALTAARLARRAPEGGRRRLSSIAATSVSTRSR